MSETKKVAVKKASSAKSKPQKAVKQTKTQAKSSVKSQTTKTVAKKNVAPKTQKKAVAKKQSAKVKKPEQYPWDVVVSGDQIFYACDSSQFRSIIELLKALDKMPEHVFHHHVSFHNNDFANWIEHVFTLRELAQELRQVHNKDESQLTILKYIIRNT